MRLKHFVSMFFMLFALSIGHVWADTANFSQSDLSGQGTSGSGSAFTGSTKGSITMGGTGYGANGHVKIYANGTLTFTPANGATITAITLTAASNYEKTWSANPGTVTVNTSNHTINWTGSSTSVVTLTNTATAQARITAMSVTYTASGSPTLQSIAVSGTPSTTIYEEGENFSVAGLTVTGTYSDNSQPAITSGITWKARTSEQANDAVALADYTLTQGQTSLQVQATYNSKESAWTTISGLTVNEHIVTPGKYGIALYNTLWGVTAGQQATTVTSMSGKAHDITLTTTKGGSQMYASASQTRFYNGSTLTISVPAGYVISEIQFGMPSTDAKWDGSITIDGNIGTWTAGDALWEGKSQSVTFNFGAQNRAAGVWVTYEADQKYAVNLSATNGTLTAKYYNDNTSFTSGTEVYDGTKLVLTATPGSTYVGGTITVKKASDNSVVTNAYVASTGILTVPAYAINVEATFTPTYAISAANVTGGTFGWTDVDNNVVSCARAEEGTNIQASNEADGAHNFASYDIYYMDGTTKVNVDNTDGLFTMPAHDVIISGSFTAKPCTPLANATNIVVSGKAYPYDAVTVTWDAVTDAAYYVVEVGSGNNMNTSSNLTTTTYTVPTTLAANTQYEYRVYAYSNDPLLCYSMVSNHFTTEDYPAATVTLNDASGVPYALSGNHKLTDVVTLPNTAAACSKNFVGWTATQGSTSAPEYNEANNYSYTISATTQNLYAVYADGGSTNGTITKTMSEIVTANSYTVSSGNNATMYKTLALNSDITLSTTGEDNCGSFWNSGTEWRLYQNKSGNAIVTAASGCTLTSVKFTFGVSNTGALLKGSDALTSGTAVSASGSSATYTVGNSGSATNGQVKITAIEVKYTKGGAYSNYTTECVASPEAVVDPEEINATSAAVANGVIEVTYNDHVNLTNVVVACFNDAACTESVAGGWLTASPNNDNDIAYTIAENTSYNDVRTAYIKLTAPETNGATDPAVVVIPVTQAKKPAVFASLEELVAADVNANTNVTVTFSDVTIKEMYEYNDKVCGVVFDIQKDNADIKIYFNNQETITDWVPGGTLSGTLTDCPWKTYSSAWQLAPKSGWAWSELTYTEPATASAVEVTGFDGQTEYIDGQAFNTNGLHARVTYTDQSYDDDPVGVTYEVTPATLTQGQTSVTVVATYNNIPSEEYVVNGLTVTAVPNKTVAQFIAAEGTRCYLTGVVSNIQTNANSSQNAHGNFNLTDATGTIYVYGCLTAEGVANEFATIGIVEGDKVTVLAESYEYYQTTHEAKNVQYVSKVPAATITIANKTMEVGDEPWTIEATTDPEGAASHLSYSIKAGSDDCITLSEGVVTATAQGTATIIASVQDGDDYMANSVEFTVTVNPAAVHTNVVILTYFGGQYYALSAMNGAVGTTLVRYEDDKVVVNNNAEKAAITWDCAERTEYTTFYNAAEHKYLKGSKSASLSLVDAEDTKTSWMYVYVENKGWCYTSNSGTETVRTFLYQGDAGEIKNYGASQAGTQAQGGYSVLPIYYTGEVIVDEQVVRDGLTPGKYGTICLEKNVVSFTGATMYSIDSKASDLSYITLEEETGALEAGRPYIFLATGSEIKVQYGTTTADAGSYNGLVGSFIRKQLDEGMYIIQNNKFYRTGADNYVGEHKAYIDMTDVPEETTLVPGRRYVTMQIGDVQTPTALDEVTVNQENAKFILNGQLYILRDGKLYNAQGQLVK